MLILAFTPSDVTLHEYRSLVYFALGKYAEAAGVLTPVLASGPGWGWDTISAQLRDLTGDSIATEDSEVEPSVKPDPVPLEKLVGTWTSESSGGKITFTMVGAPNGDPGLDFKKS